ncbi:leucyl/phenylalanyl-tRNA--protein transferase [Candidatus Nitrosacidococcus sp. I8]|uniref:leucyl/phenylalanyl-tRNA--protein transferase n=1 Tax=Candidatus Nitrosacidococcus sp. I8 TaxID=2942908 RepID=UPI0022271BAC|nr:leucyl/phenylalanyl-tRNA--protein transferase [Candidatus Nitrosacidococcus sp. I8]CAH9019699.1 Leucyl/phenylalanyl-tRNA--protein transferase [Candidatus Nitrosacidococcus sp. I8]
MVSPYYIDSNDSSYFFPNPKLALLDPNGLLAVGGDLSQKRIIYAYCQGIFPWYSQGQPILWWSPNPRMVLFPSKLKISRNLKKKLNRSEYTLTIDKNFQGVIQACANTPRHGIISTWLTIEMQTAYIQLHDMGIAHSIEVWEKSNLIGGLYGLHIGRIFFGESMFSLRSDASKIALVYLCNYLQQKRVSLIDCQVESAHLFRLGAQTITRDLFIRWVQKLCNPSIVDDL